MNIEMEHDRVKELFESYNGYEISNWKHIVMELAHIANTTNIFTINARSGFGYLNAVVYNEMCRKCHDEKAFQWLMNFSKAWLNRESLPLFNGRCWTEECE